MRKRFEQQISLGIIPISETPYSIKSRDATVKLTVALLEIYNNVEFNEKIFSILEEYLVNNKQKTGRLGMDLWQIFVMAQFRVGLDLSYDRLEYLVNGERTIRTLLGIETTGFGIERKEFSYQNIVDNVKLLTDEMLSKINDVIVGFGEKEVFKKKAGEAYILKTDSYVVESNVHFPTDYNLLWDSIRKSLDMVGKILKENPELKGWRKLKNWQKRIKNLSRSVGQTSSKGGKNKEEALIKVVEQYLKLTSELCEKLIDFLPEIPTQTIKLQLIKSDLEKFILLTIKHIDLLKRRVINKETIPHSEKLFSIFEQYTEWINKGKSNPNVELGKKLAITTNQYHLIVDYRIMEYIADSEILTDIAADLLKRLKNIKSWSFDKGYWSKENKELLAPEIGKLILPKKGKCNKVEMEEEKSKEFKILRNKHSAIESNINELENRGLNKCPDRGFAGFKRYIGIGVCAYNLHKIGTEIIQKERERLKKLRKAA